MAAPAKGPANWPLVAGFWALIAALLLIRNMLQEGAVPLYGDGDDAMRIVTATDLLHGQPWQDLVQHRDNAPFGVAMHWSRLIDAPIAGLIAAFRPLVGAAATDAAAMAWPLLLMLALMALSVAVVRRLVPQAGTMTGAALPVASLVLLIEFLPGRVDHHNVQILLTLVLLLALLASRDRIAGGMVAGLAIATSLAIGLETLPIAAAAIVAYALFWLAEPGRYRLPLASFGATLALGTAAHFVAATPPHLYAVPACDALSIVHLASAGLGGGALVATSLLVSRLRKGWQRALLLLLAGGMAAAVVAQLYPACLGSPYANVAPAMMDVFFADIAEAQSLPERLAVDPATGIAFALTPLVALPVTLWRVLRTTGEDRSSWTIVLLLLAAACLVMVVQMRGARLATVFAFPAAAWVVAEARAKYLHRPRLAAAGLLAGAWLLFSGAAQFGLLAAAAAVLPYRVTPAAAPLDGAMPRLACFLGGNFDALAALPRGTVMTPIRLGPHILRYTGHRVVGTGFHRNHDGFMDTAAFFAGAEDEALKKGIVAARDIDYVVTCPGSPLYEGRIGPHDGQVWSWLEPLSDPAARLQVYRVNL